MSSAAYDEDDDQFQFTESSKDVFSHNEVLEKYFFSYFSLPMILDKKTETYVKFSQVMLIFQSPEFEKRKQIVQDLKTTFKDACVVISDENFKKETSLCFRPEHTENFSDYFKRKCKESCKRNCNLIIIDQSLSSERNSNLYCSLAAKMHYVVLVIPPDFNKCRSHSTVKNQASSFEKSDVPIDYVSEYKHYLCGWFLKRLDSSKLREYASLYINDCFKYIPIFSKQFQFCTAENFISYYNLNSEDLASCIVTVFRSRMGALHYFRKENVRNMYGKASTLKIFGFIISRNIIAARVSLTLQQKRLWRIPFAVVKGKVRESALFPSKRVDMAMSKLQTERLDFKISERIAKQSLNITNPVHNLQFGPTGKSCHILLGKSDNATYENRDYDVQKAIEREGKYLETNVQSENFFDLPRSQVLRLGQYWFIYLKQIVEVDGLFSSLCEPSG